MQSAFALIMSILLGVMAGVGLFTFHFAEGISYFSNDPNACANCHVMDNYLDSWQQASHHTRAVCNDCHTPHALGPKLITKAINGWNHSVAFTLRNYVEPLRITERNARILQANCISCHAEMVSEIRAPHPGGSDVDCVKCHAGVGHGLK
jgi:cytochrome c nitrite reductase small subunit